MPGNKTSRVCFYWKKQCGQIFLNQYDNRANKAAKTSATPGKTQLINHFEILSSNKKKWYMVDLPGYGYAKRSQSARNNWENMIESYIRKRENLVCLFVLIDSRHEPQAKDLKFIFTTYLLFNLIRK